MKRILLLFVLLALCRLAFGQNEPRAYFIQSRYQSCTAPLSVTFKDTSWSPVNSPMVFWKWEFGDGTVDSSGPVVTHTYLQKGKFNIKLTVRDQEGRQSVNIANSYQFVRIGAALELPSAIYFCENRFPVLSNLAAPVPYDSLGTYRWIWHTIPISTAHFITPDRTGTYELYYTACDTVLYGLTSVMEQTVNPGIIEAPTWINDTVKHTFRVNSMIYHLSKVSQISWLFHDGSTAVTKGGSTLDHVVSQYYTAPGNYSLRATVRLIDPADMVCDSAGTYTVTIVAPEVTHNSWNRRDTLLQGSSITLSAGNPGATYNWKSTDPAFSASTQTVTLTKPGKYWVQIKKTRDVITDTINISPKFDFNFSQRRHCGFTVDTSVSFIPDITIPAGDSLFSITWDYGDGTSNVYYNTYSYSYSHTYSAGGTYTVVMDVKLKSGYTKIISKLVPVDPSLDWNVEIQDDTVSMPGVHILTPINVRPSGVGARIKWWAQPRRIEAFIKPIGDTIQAILPGLYVAHLIDSCGGIWTHDTIEVRDPFTSEWKASIKTFVTSGCWDTTIVSVNTNAPKGTYQILWNTGETTDTIIATRQGRYSFTFTDNIGKKRKDSADVTIYPRDIATLDVSTKNGRDTLVAGPYNRNSQYFFYRNDTLLSKEQFNFNNLYDVQIPGIYKVVVRNLRGCQVTSLPLYYKISQDSVVLNFSYTSDKCISQQIKFTGTAVSANNQETVRNVKWNFGDGMTATYPGGNNTVSHYYETAGTYAVSFTATTATGRTFSSSKQVTVQSGVVYSVEITKDDAPDNMRILRAIKNPANGFITWSNGSTKDTIHVYTSGEYSVWMKDSCGNVRDADSVYIGMEDKWTVQASITGWTTCGDSAILFATVTPPGEGYTITWSNGAKSDVTYATVPGVYSVVVKDSDGEVTSSDSVMVNLKPFKASLELHRSATPGNDTLIVYPNNASDTGNYYRWYRDGVQISFGPSPMLNNPIPGLYKAYAFNKAGCVVETDTVRCMAGPVLSLDFDYVTSPCDAQWIRFIGSANTKDLRVTYKWNFGDGREMTNPNQFGWNRYAAAGTYNVTLKVTTSSGLTDSITKQVIVNADQEIWSANITKQGNQCGDTVWLTASSTNIKAGSFTWSTGEEMATIAVTESGRYAVDVLDSCYNVRASDTVDVIINAPCLPNIPVDTISIGNGPIEGGKVLPVTAGFDHGFNVDNIFTVQLTLQDPGGRETGIQPDEVINLGSMPGTTKDITMQVDIPDTLACATSYAVRVVANSPADTTAWSQLFTIANQPAQPVITQRGDSLFTSGKYNWQWYFNDKAIEGATSATYRARTNGSYTVESLNGNGCSSKSSPVSVIITAVGEVALGGNKVKAFPNPSEGQVSLQFEKPLQKAVVIKVYNLNGRVMYTRTTTQQLLPLDLSALPKGYYLIELTGYGQKKVLSLLLQ